jgi:hypothetical protein
MTFKWIKLTEREPEGSGPYLYFPVYAVAGHSIHTTNGEYLRGPHIRNREEVYWAEFEMPPGYNIFELKRDEWESEPYENPFEDLKALDGVVHLPNIQDEDGIMADDVFEMLEEDHEKTSECYPDGTPKTYYPNKPWLNKYGYLHRAERCNECGEWECDPNGIGHYRG